MIAFLFSTAGYFATGYFTFRVWTWRCRPQNGTFGNNYAPCWKLHDGWFTPSWADTSSKNGVPRGQSIQITFWQSALTWPLVWLFASIKCLNIMGQSICKSACKSATKHVLPPPTIEEEYMIEGTREVENLLTEEK